MTTQTDEIECRDCDGNGERICNWTFQNRLHRTVEQCTACNGHGWRDPTPDELDSMAEDAYQRQFEGEPPISQRERDEMQAKRDAQWV
jgi:hypothetical protein